MPPLPHADAEVFAAGAPLAEAPGAVVLLHGRGASAPSILTLADEFDRPDLAYLAPQAEGFTWYPHSFLAPLGANEPHLSGALATLARVVEEIETRGITRDRIVLAGFSQGACLASEFVARNAGRWGGLAALSGGLIGSADDPETPGGKRFDYDGALDATPVFLGCSDRDPHIPKTRVETSAAVLGTMGADVTLRLYPGLGHTVNTDEIDHVRQILRRLGT